MTKSELRKARKVAAAEGRNWNIETSESGGLEIIWTRTQAEEYRHQCRMERWARRNYDRD